MVFDRYLFKNLLLATLFASLSLAMIIMLAQSLRFLELIINSGASGFSFLALTLLAMPRFFEVILPIGLMVGTVFIYNRMITDSEMVIMQSSGYSPLRLSRPALMLAIAGTVLVFIITAWLAPVSLAKMQLMRVTIKAQYSNMLLKEGVFNALGKNMTVYVHRQKSNGDMEGLLIHDSRDAQELPVTVLARRGTVVSDIRGQQVIVYDGSRQQYNPQTGVLDKLDFQRYSLDLPEAGPVRERWREPDERTLYELINPDKEASKDLKTLRAFQVEAHRRLASPFLALTFTVISLCCLLLGSLDRRSGLGWRVLLASAGVVLLQGLYLVAYNLAKEHTYGLILMYGLALVPLAFGLYLLTYGRKGPLLKPYAVRTA
jgi:lipopolysaccharide export system permease protein